MSLTSPVYTNAKYHRRGAQVGKKLTRKSVTLTPKEQAKASYQAAKPGAWGDAEIANRLVDLEVNERA